MYQDLRQDQLKTRTSPVEENEQTETNPNPTRTVHREDQAMGEYDDSAPKQNADGNSKSRSYAEVVKGKVMNETKSNAQGLIQLKLGPIY